MPLNQSLILLEVYDKWSHSISVILIKAVRSKPEEHEMEFDRNDEQSTSENEQEEHDDSCNDDNDVDDDAFSSNEKDKKEGYLNTRDETVTSIGFCAKSSKYEHDNKDEDDHKQKERNIHTGNMERYIPPHLRNQTSSESHSEHINRITCQMKGLLNRYKYIQSLNNVKVNLFCYCLMALSILSPSIALVFIATSAHFVNFILL